MRFAKVAYSTLNSRQKEVYNFHKVAAVLAEYGFNCLRLIDDWQGADFLAYHKDGHDTLRVQLKSRLYIAKKYRDKNLYLCFPLAGTWYLVLHDELIEAVGRHTTYLTSASWRKRGSYSSDGPNKELLKWLRNFVL